MAETVFVSVYLKDGENASVGRKARVKAINAFDSDHWGFHEMTGSDVGIDMKFELIENHEFPNNRIECQIKGCPLQQYNQLSNLKAFSIKYI
jgi:hypothetical protein